jgi:hypothetical protein
MMQVDRKTRYEQMRTMLNEKQWRQFLALEAKARGSILSFVRSNYFRERPKNKMKEAKVHGTGLDTL